MFGEGDGHTSAQGEFALIDLRRLASRRAMMETGMSVSMSSCVVTEIFRMELRLRATWHWDSAGRAAIILAVWCGGGGEICAIQNSLDAADRTGESGLALFLGGRVVASLPEADQWTPLFVPETVKSWNVDEMPIHFGDEWTPI
jgi:hypothetical protein